MRKIREILRLDLVCNMVKRDIARSCAISHSTVLKYSDKAKELGLSYEQIEKMDDNKLRQMLKVVKSSRLCTDRPKPDWNLINQELKKKGVTLELLFEEYKEIHTDGYQKSQFNFLYNQWLKKLNVSMRKQPMIKLFQTGLVHISAHLSISGE